jgi:tRNA pseudouridine38-40 synthase
VADTFDARHSARWRRYRYSILNRPDADPFSAATAWHVERPLDVPAMRLAADPLLGEHDFSSFCRRPPDRADGTPASLTRRVTDVGWTDEGDGRLRFEIQASSFCHQMVRSVVGLLVEVGTGKRRAVEVNEVIRARSRAGAGQLAPPHGLCLWAVGYDPAPVHPMPDDQEPAARRG